MKSLSRVAAAFQALLLLLSYSLSQAGAQEPEHAANMTLHAEAVGPMRFLAVHGRRSVIMGYPTKGLEVWGYPFQLVTDYQVGFVPRGTTAEIDGRSLLRRIDYNPDSVTRIYIGPDYLVREKIFVPLDEPAAVITYEIEGAKQLDINIHFQPVLDLMWPGAIGGQYTRWVPEGPAYQISEPANEISAMVGSVESIAHDDTLNSTVPATTRKSFTIRPHSSGRAASTATVYFLLNAAHAKEPAAALHFLSTHLAEKEAEAKAHYLALQRAALRVHTPDEEVNSAVAWAENALDQAWVCNPLIGCGLVAGYGPSRAARRPQYDWYFAGDGLIATNALVSAGEYSRAREELEFVAKYQEPKTGMIWHEISQSSGYIDWSKYLYMYVHVDISFDYLSTVARYVVSSGDTSFAISQWPSIVKAYGYCRSLIRDIDHLPHIPADKEGGDEQARPGDDLALSAGWLSASSGFEELARLTGHTQLAEDARARNQLARKSIPARYWDAKGGFWIDGHTQAGAPVVSRRLGPSSLIEQQVFSAPQNEALLDQLASSDFQTDWGVREVAASSPDYDPYSYGRGSITAPGSTQTAITFWKMHRPAIGQTIWSEVLFWNSLDALGHVHEVLAGNFYHEQAESVPEQTWSSAGLLSATVRGLLGINVHGSANSIELAPHVPALWKRISIENVRLPRSTVDFTLSQSIGDLELEINNKGAATKVLFRPQVPLGAQILGATYEERPIPVEAEMFSEDEHAKVSLVVPSGVTHCHLELKGGISIMLPPRRPHTGDPSTGLKLTSLQLHESTLSVEADVHPQGNATLRLRTPWKITARSGASVSSLADSEYEITFDSVRSPVNSLGYTHGRATLIVAPK